MAQILYVTGQSTTVYRTHRKGAQVLARFVCNDLGYNELVRWLRSSEPHPLAILVELIEEEFREETLPHAIGRDRGRLHARQAGKLFRATPFRYHRVVGRQRDGRRDDRVLFSALTNRDSIEPLLHTLVGAGIAIRGIYSLPIITHRLMKPLAIKSGNVLIITEQPDGGLRETFLREGRAHFSRLAPINDCSPDAYGHIVKAEAHKTRRYLNNLRLLPPNQPLAIYALCDGVRMAALRAILSDESDLLIHPVSLSDTARKVGFAEHPDTQFSDALFCHLLQTRLTGNHYASAPQLCHWQTYKAKLGLRAAAWLLAVGSVTLAGKNIVDGRMIEQETGQLDRITAQVNHDYRRAANALPVKPSEAVAMRDALRFADKLDAYPVHLKALFRLLGRGFSRQPGFAMDELNWFVAASPDSTALPEVQHNNGPLTITETPYLITKVSGHVRNFNGSYR